MQAFLDSLSNILYAYVLIILLIGCGIYFTVRTGGVQFRLLKDSCRLLFHSNDGPSEGKHVSSFQAFAISLASRVGTGNLVGPQIIQIHNREVKRRKAKKRQPRKRRLPFLYIV